MAPLQYAARFLTTFLTFLACLACLTWLVPVSGLTPAWAAEGGPADVRAVSQRSTDTAPLPGNEPNVVVILTTAVTWDSMTAIAQHNPAVHAFLSSATGANLVPLELRRQPASTAASWIRDRSDCALDSWITLNSGAVQGCKSAAFPIGCPNLDASYQHGTASHEFALPWWHEMSAAATKPDMLGALAASVANAGIEPTVIGTGAGIMLADDAGRLPNRWLAAPLSDGALNGLVAALLPDSRVTVVDASSEQVRQFTAEILLPLAVSPFGESLVPLVATSAVEALTDGSTARLASLIELVPETSTLIVASLASGPRPQLQFFAVRDRSEEGAQAAAPHTAPAYFESETVRQPHIIETTDIFPLIQRALTGQPLGIGMDGRVGEILTSGTLSDPSARNATLIDRALKAEAIRFARNGFNSSHRTGAEIVLGLALVIAGVWAWRRRHPSSRLAMAARRLDDHPRAKAAGWGALAVAGCTTTALPVASHVVSYLPWWRHPHWMLIGGSWALALVIAAGALGVAWWQSRDLGGRDTQLAEHTGATQHPQLTRLTASLVTALLIVTGLTAAVFAGDLATHTHHMADSPMGFNVLAGARFFGLGNEAYGVVGPAFLGMTVLALIAAPGCTRLLRLGATTAVACGSIVLIGFPSFGADFGGLLAIVPALIVMVAMVGRWRIRPRTVVLTGVLTVAVAAAVMLLDWLRPADQRTHMGRFVQSVIDGNFTGIIVRKLSVNAHLALNPTFFVPILLGLAVVVAILWPWWKKADAGVLRTTWVRIWLASVAACLVVATGVNDSGVPLLSTACTTYLPTLAVLGLTGLKAQESPSRTTPCSSER